MNFRVLIVSVIFVGGCASAYGPRSGTDVCDGPGYSEELVADGVFRVTYTGKPEARAGVKRGALRRASELCNGAFVAEIPEGEEDVESVLCGATEAGGDPMLGTPVVSLVIICR